MTKNEIQKLMFEAAKVTLFLDEDKLFYTAGRTPDGSDEMIVAEKGYISTEFMDNIIKQVAKECVSMIDNRKELSEAYGAYGDGLDEAIELICNRYGVER
jgi:hypothetical protein